MNNKKEGLLGTLVLISGIMIGAAGTLLYKENKPLNAGKILENVKSVFASQGEVVGSWIDYDPVEYSGFDSRPLVYAGGITRLEDNRPVHYSFTADIYSGEIIDTYILNK